MRSSGTKGLEKSITKWHKKTFWGEGFIYHLGRGDGFMNVHMYQNLPKCTL